MTRSISRWITTVSAAVALGLPVMGLAQTPAPQTPPQQTPPQQTPPAQQPPAQPQPTTQPPAAAAATPDADKAVTPQEHLRKAKAALDKVQPTSFTGPARAQFTELKRHLTALEGIDTSKPAGSATSTTARAKANWGTDAAAIDKILANLLGESTTGTTGVTGAPGAAGTTGATAAKATLDEATRAALMDVRKHVVAFATGMSGAASPKNDAAAPQSDAPMTPSEQSPSSATPSAAAPSSATPSSATPSSATPTTPEQSAPTTPEQSTPTPAAPSAATASAATQTPATPSSAASAQPVDQEAARRHLVAARDSLNQLTQLPAAAQLSGESRTQVTQLIANFNELITTQSQWRASYAKVSANLNAVLGPENTDAEATGGVATPTAGSTPAPGAVGTSGAAMDPAVRAKLVEMRRHLMEFEKSMGGPAL
jgi:hypothetical protein